MLMGGGLSAKSPCLQAADGVASSNVGAAMGMYV
jgi:hypothetical protein